jgi:hypothetical protein
MAAKRKIDWESIESDWRIGVKSVLQIAFDYEDRTGVSVSHTAINRHFKTLGVPRDLSAKVQAKAQAIVSASMVSANVSTETNPSDAQIINDAASIVAAVQLSHRQDVQRYRRLCKSMLSQLEAETDNPELFEQIGELLADPDDKGTDKLNEAYRKAISLPQRIDGVKKLAETLKVLIGLERQAFGIADNAEGDKPKPQEEQNMPPRELARRIAFALSIGLKDAQSANPATPQQ